MDFAMPSTQYYRREDEENLPSVCVCVHTCPHVYICVGGQSWACGELEAEKGTDPIRRGSEGQAT